MNSRLKTQSKADQKKFFAAQNASLSHVPTDSMRLKKTANCREAENCRQGNLLQQQSTNRDESSKVPPIVYEALHSLGQPLNSNTRTSMEKRFGHDFGNLRVNRVTSGKNRSELTLGQPNDRCEMEADRTARSVIREPEPAETDSLFNFSNVRIHTDAKSVESAQAVSAKAYTAGNDIVFGEGQYAPGTIKGQALLAHELTHVVDFSPGRILRDVASDYDQIEDRLTYGIFDWVITDADAHDVLEILSGLNPADLSDTLNQMEADGLLSRLLENISSADQTTYASLIQTIRQQRSTSAVASHIESLMSYGFLDWVITDAEAHEALEALKSLRSMPDRLRDVVTSIPGTQYERFYDNLSEADRTGNLRFLQDIEMIRRTGMTFDEMSAAQRTHLEAQAVAAGVSVGEYIRGEATSRGYGGYTAAWWPSLLPSERAAWTARFDAILVRIRAEAPEELRQIIEDAERGGGGIQWDPQRIEELGPNTYAYRRGRVLGVGKLWLETAEGNLPDVYENIAHELGGHHEYGATASWDIMRGTLSSLPAGERTIAESGPRSLYSAYGYMETEIYAELREIPYRTPGSRGDDPATNIEEELNKINDAFEPNIAEAIVRGLRRRIQLDRRISDEARNLFDQKVRDVFHITF